MVIYHQDNGYAIVLNRAPRSDRGATGTARQAGQGVDSRGPGPRGVVLFCSRATLGGIRSVYSSRAPPIYIYTEYRIPRLRVIFQYHLLAAARTVRSRLQSSMAIDRPPASHRRRVVGTTYSIPYPSPQRAESDRTPAGRRGTGESGLRASRDRLINHLLLQ